MNISALSGIGPIRSFLSSRQHSAADTISRLSESGFPKGSLALLAEENGEPAGALVTVPGSSGEVRLSFTVCCAYDSADTLAALFTRACEMLRTQGCDYLFTRMTEDEKDIFYKKLGFEWIVSLGFVPPVLGEDALSYSGIKLREDASPSCLPLTLPDALAVPTPKCLFYGKNVISEEEYAVEVYTTRDRRRLAERAALMIFIIAVAAVGIIRRDRYALTVIPMIGIGLHMLFQNIFRPKKFTRDLLERRREKGLSGTDELIFFGEDHFIQFSRGHGRAIVSYDNIITVYVKRDFIFLCSKADNTGANGWFVRNDSLSDKEAFLDHIRRKAPGAVFKR